MITNIISPIMIVTVIGTVAGVILSVASILLHTPVDETQEKLRECLPGANCGACGYAGCDSYAEAIAAGDADVSLCVPGGASTKSLLAGIMGVDAGGFRRMAAFVTCNGTADNATEKMRYIGAESCAAANQIFGGSRSCVYGCMGYGDCVTVCEYDAIYISNGVSVVDPNKCVGCKRCITACPKSIISLVPAESTAYVVCSSHDKGPLVKKACSVGCIGCTKCVKVCPQEAISMNNFLAIVDYDKCTACGLCADSCPQKCISIQ